jgi:transcription initiation factor TFIIE subunit alpha
MSMDKDEATRRQERDAEAEAKRQQNALPEWIRKSTVSGHLTASGVAESARAENAAGPSSSNDEILRGLGTVGPARVEESKVSIVEDLKPVVDHDQIGEWP